MAYEIKCDYKTKTNWFAIDNVYFCDLANNVTISKCDNTVTAVTGRHLDGKSNADVVGFRSENKILHYFPRGLENFFIAAKFVFINVWSSGLKEIHEADLAPFTNLKFISFSKNDLVVVERDLFINNPQLEIIGFPRNKITTVDTNAFDHLNNLVSLYMDHNVCISKEVTRNRKRVLQLIEEMKIKCK